MKDCIKIYKKTTLKLFLKLKMPEYLIYAPFESIYHTVHCGFLQAELEMGLKYKPSIFFMTYSREEEEVALLAEFLFF